jgi:hypothetical protein
VPMRRHMPCSCAGCVDGERDICKTAEAMIRSVAESAQAQAARSTASGERVRTAVPRVAACDCGRVLQPNARSRG